MNKKKIKGYKEVTLVGDCGSFRLTYLPAGKHGKMQRLQLEAEDEEGAKHEASVILGCKPEDLEVEWE